MAEIHFPLLDIWLSYQSLLTGHDDEPALIHSINEVEFFSKCLYKTINNFGLSEFFIDLSEILDEAIKIKLFSLQEPCNSCTKCLPWLKVRDPVEVFCRVRPDDSEEHCVQVLYLLYSQSSLFGMWLIMVENRGAKLYFMIYFVHFGHEK